MDIGSIISSLQQKLKDEGLLTEKRKSVFDKLSQNVGALDADRRRLENMVASLHQKGASGTGGLIGQIARMVKPGENKNIVLEPGDFVRSLTGKGTPVAVSAPLAYDVWYLHNHVNFFKWVKDENAQTYYDERLNFIKEKLASGGKTIRPLRGLTKPQSLNISSSFSIEKMQDLTVVKNESEYFMQLMAFEIRLKDLPIQWDTERVGLSIGNDFVGYFTFPIGQIGVMEQIAFFQESWSDEPNGSEQYRPTSDEKVFNPDPTELFPPKESFETHCYGDYLMEGWTKSPEDTGYGKQLDVLCKGVPTASYGGKDVAPKGWLRLWILEEDVFPVPGEFVGILCKPYPVPVHCWWFQESNPFLYAGNWFDTGNLSSGIVEQITLEANRQAGSVGDEYKIRYHGILITVYASDFYRYTVGERVAVLKVGSTATKATRAFSFVDQKNYGEPEKNSTSTDYVIVPLTYYKE